MKKILFLLLSTIAMYGQVPADATPLENIQITNNTQSTTATKVNVQEANGTINTISKSDLVNVVEVNDVPSLPLVGEVGKIYVVKNVNKIYRWNGTFYQELAVSDINYQSIIDALTFTPENVANKANDFTTVNNALYPTVQAVKSQLDLKANDSNVVHLAGAETITGQKTFSPTISASGAIARGTYLTPSLTATANNDVLVGLDINTTFTNGAFTGTKSLPVRVTSNQYIGMNVSRNSTGGSAITISNNNGGYNFGVGSINEFFIQRAGGNIVNTIFSTGNSIIQNGGAFTDDLTNRLQVTGTVSSGTTALGNTPPTANNQLTRKDYVDTGLVLKADIASPSLTGTPTAPTATAGTNTTQVATTAFVTGAIATADAGNVKLTGAQTVLGVKTFSSSPIVPTAVNANEAVNKGQLDAVFDGLALKSNIGHTHVASQITDLSKASVGLGNVDNTSDLSKPLSTATINALATKFPTPTGLTTNYLPKWNGSGFGNSNVFDNGTNIGIGTATPIAKLHIDVASSSSSSGSDGFRIASGLMGLNLGTDSTNNYSWISSSLGGVGSRALVLQPVGGRVLINKTDDDLTNQLQVAGTISASPATTANQVVVKSQLDAAARPYKVYTALLTQTGTNAPVATVLENTLGATISYSLGGTGFVVATSSTTSFTDPNKVFISISNGNGAGFFSVLRIQTNQVRIVQQNIAGANTDGLLQTANFEIRVYN